MYRADVVEIWQLLVDVWNRSNNGACTKLDSVDRFRGDVGGVGLAYELRWESHFDDDIPFCMRWWGLRGRDS